MVWTETPRQDLAGQPQRQVTDAALRYLSRREYTACELRQRLNERGADSAAIEETLLYLRERAYQSDARASESHIRQRLCSAPRGRALIRQELEARGIDAELAERLLDEHYPPQTERALLKRLLDKETAPSPANTEQARRFGQKLLRRFTAKGFERSMLMEELANILPLPPQYMD